MTQNSTTRRRLLVAGGIVAAILVLAAFLTIFLVLTGIIAEPETVIESIVRALAGLLGR